MERREFDLDRFSEEVVARVTEKIQKMDKYRKGLIVSDAVHEIDEKCQKLPASKRQQVNQLRHEVQALA